MNEKWLFPPKTAHLPEFSQLHVSQDFQISLFGYKSCTRWRFLRRLWQHNEGYQGSLFIITIQICSVSNVDFQIEISTWLSIIQAEVLFFAKCIKIWFLKDKFVHRAMCHLICCYFLKLIYFIIFFSKYRRRLVPEGCNC